MVGQKAKKLIQTLIRFLQFNPEAKLFDDAVKLRHQKSFYFGSRYANI
jgi:hypothetical protein